MVLGGCVVIVGLGFGLGGCFGFGIVVVVG